LPFAFDFFFDRFHVEFSEIEHFAHCFYILFAVLRGGLEFQRIFPGLFVQIGEHFVFKIICSEDDIYGIILQS